MVAWANGGQVFCGYIRHALVAAAGARGHEQVFGELQGVGRSERRQEPLHLREVNARQSDARLSQESAREAEIARVELDRQRVGFWGPWPRSTDALTELGVLDAIQIQVYKVLFIV